MQMRDIGLHFAMRLLRTVGFAVGASIFAFGGVLVGGIAGAMEGQTTEMGFCRGSLIGIISGAIASLDLLDSAIHGGFKSNVRSIVDGKAFMEWVSPVVLKAYEWQTDLPESHVSEVRDMYNVDESQGLTLELIDKFPMVEFHHDQIQTHSDDGVCCAICLQDLVEGERVRPLPFCEHMFHLHCIDEWLLRSASCPTCRHELN